MIDTFISIIPQPWRRARLSGKRHFTDKKSAAYKRAIGWAITPLLKEPFRGAVHLDLDFVFPIPKSWSKAKKMNPPPHTSRPDRDNLEKAIGDALNGIAWDDDAQICDGNVRKRYGTEPGIFIKIKEA